MRSVVYMSFILGCSSTPGNIGDCTGESCNNQNGDNTGSSCWVPFIGMTVGEDIDAGIATVFSGAGNPHNDAGVDSGSDGSVDGSVDSGVDANDASVNDSGVIDGGSDGGPVSCNIACDPNNCQAYTNTATTTDSIHTYSGAGTALSTVAGTGWGKQLASPCNPASQVGCEYDSYCAANGVCTLYSPGQTIANGIDLTAEAACYMPDGSAVFPLCNRGKVDAISGTTVIGFDQNPSPSLCAPEPNPYPSKGTCVVNFANTPLKSGQCIDLNPTTMQNLVSCSGVNISGNRDWMVNVDGKFSETNLCNNEGYLKSNQACSNIFTPQTFIEPMFVPSCPAGKVPQWKSLAYASTIGSSGGTSAQVQFSAQLAPMQGDGGIGAWGSSILLTTAPTNSPALCPLTGPNPCPIDLTKLFTSNGAENDALLLTIKLIPSSDGLASAVVSGDQILYDCVDYQ